MIDALHETSLTAQEIVATQSAELLDNDVIDPAWILVAGGHAGATRIGPLADPDFSAVHERLYTLGALMRMWQVRPDGSSPLGPLGQGTAP